MEDYEPVVGSSNGITATTSPYTYPPYWVNQYPHPPTKSALLKPTKKKVKKPPIPPAFCEVCKVDCNSADVLKTHKQGRKHKKNLQKLQESITPKPVVQAPTTTVASSQETLDANQGNTVTLGQQTKKKKKKAAATAASAEELELKKRRVLTGGAAEENVKVCTVCNVVANNQKVFDYHIAGQKHAAMVKKQQERERQTAPVS
ncbi:zinc finger protein 346-like [Ananas comosus]|uniref:Zinc finger protein 346-like n=1 Tax=Ananas comosus TaxID=4615 RepID=A0A6P5FXD2_ANACO|nr:zinc finger protein 346-like [Ananas comosus]XP_020100669.1 zinc finger protein 346-like [Ananas comosus]XP_020100670.1 zinc finger protein 346-like [Ananas comosus]XP_020100671.1 zinc finger protein 346-like [Ananas comosus]